MPNIRILILASILICFLVVLAIIRFPANDLSGYGSIISAGGAFLAVVWFSGSLWYQSQQLREQRIQFLAEFKHLQASNRRDSLQLAKTILDTAEQKALSHIDSVSKISELSTCYLNFHELKPILESDDPQTVFNSCEAWLKKESAALTLLKGIKHAAEIHLQTSDIQGIDYTLKPEDFVFIYGCHFWKLPFFDVYQATATILCKFMIQLEPGRASVPIAMFAASSKLFGTKMLKMDQIREDIKNHLAKGYPLPKIAEGL